MFDQERFVHVLLHIDANRVNGRTALPFGASFVDHGNNTGTFSWTPLSSQAGSYLIRILGNNGLTVETAYVRITVRLTPPPNDEIENAIAITGLPFSYTQQTTSATSAPDDPFCNGSNASVWFAFTPAATGRVEFNTGGSNYDTTLSAYTGTRGNLSQVACTGGFSRIRFDVSAGVTYYIMVGALFSSAGGSLTLNLLEAPPAFTMQFSLDQFSRVIPSSGAVFVNGTTICSREGFVFVNGSIRQKRGGRELVGFFGAFVPCNGVTLWEAPVSYLTCGLFSGRAAALFAGGKADMTATAQAFDPEEGTFIVRNAAATVTLRGAQ